MSIKGDILDIPDLQRRGILKKKEEASQEGEANVQMDKSGYVDLSKQNASSVASSSENLSNPFSFLDSLANAGTNNAVNNSANLDLQTLKVKLEDLEYKLDRLMEKVAKLESEK